MDYPFTSISAEKVNFDFSKDSLLTLREELSD